MPIIVAGTGIVYQLPKVSFFREVYNKSAHQKRYHQSLYGGDNNKNHDLDNPSIY